MCTNKKHLLRFNHISMKTVGGFIDGLSNLYQNIEIQEGTWKGKVVKKIDNLCLEWNAIWFAIPAIPRVHEDAEEVEDGDDGGGEEVIKQGGRGKMMQERGEILNLLCRMKELRV